MENQTYDAGICIMTKILRLMEGRWKPIILHLIRNEVNRFGLLKRSMPRISKKILTEQLRELEDDGIINRRVYGSKAPYVVIYSLTEKGIALRKLMDDMFNWGLVYLKNEYDEDVIKKFTVETPITQLLKNQVS